MEWQEMFLADRQPNETEISDFIHCALWQRMTDYLSRAYLTKPKICYSGCSMQRGWNVKFSKGGKSLCTLYPMDGYFMALIVIGAKEMHEAELLLPALSSAYVRQAFYKTKTWQDSKWMMLEIRDQETLEDALKLIALRVKPKIK